eukprot:6471841-Lingulodinium_polyedra.AAC.1
MAARMRSPTIWRGASPQVRPAREEVEGVLRRLEVPRGALYDELVSEDHRAGVVAGLVDSERIEARSQ